MNRASSTMQVYLAASEVEEIATDPKAREHLLNAMRTAARAKGRHRVELIDTHGVVVASGAA